MTSANDYVVRPPAAPEGVLRPAPVADKSEDLLKRNGRRRERKPPRATQGPPSDPKRPATDHDSNAKRPKPTADADHVDYYV
jgi:hypothetical protein